MVTDGGLSTRGRHQTTSRPACTRLVLVVLLVAALSVLLAPADPVAAQSLDPGSTAGMTECPLEQEPNDVPEGAPELAGPACQLGALPEGDAQDLAIWTVTDTDAAQSWTFTIDGVPGAVTSLRLLPILSETGVEPVEIGAQLLQVDGTPDEPAGASIPVLLLPGRYLLGVSRSAFSPRAVPDDLAYRYAIEPTGSLPATGDVESNDDPTQAGPSMADSFQLTGDGVGSSDLYSWTLSGTDTQEWWQVTAQGALGNVVTLTLLDADAAILATQSSDPDGRASLFDLDLDPGSYLLQVDASGDPTAPYLLAAAAQPSGDGDAEPNDDPTTALSIELGTTVSGRIARTGDIDGFRFTLDDANASVLLDAKLIWFGPTRRTLCLVPWVDGTRGFELKCVDGIGGLAIKGLALAPGDYALTVKGEPDPDDPYHVRVDGTSAAQAGYETEPNDTATTATPVQLDAVSHGRSENGDPDHYLLHVTGEPQLWQVDVEGGGLDQLAVTRIDGDPLAHGTVDPTGTRASLVDLYLTPGDHWLLVSGRGGDYDLRFTPLGPPDPDSEHEPNNDSIEAERLDIGAPRSGRLPAAGDVDVWRFSTVATERLVLHVEPPADGAAAVTLSQSGRAVVSAPTPAVGEPMAHDLLLPPGDYEVVLQPGIESAERYRIWLERQDPLTVAIDQEPNDTFADARPVPPDGVITGQSGPSGGADWFLLPSSVDGLPVEVAVEGAVTYLAVNDGYSDYPLSMEDDGAYRSGGLPVDTPMALIVNASGPYRLTVGAAVAAPEVEPADLPVDLAMSLPADAPAAYWPAAQQLDGVLVLTATGQVALDLTLDAVTSDPLVGVTFAQSTVHLEPGASVEVPLVVRFLADLPVDQPIRLTARARDAGGSQRTTFAEVVAGADSPPLSPEQGWTLPPSMLGGLDVASLSLGAFTQPSLDAVGEDALHDGVTLAGTGLDAPFGALPLDLTVDLAGDEPVPVAGAILDPLAGGSTFQGVVRDFDLLLSTDGVTFLPVLSGTLSPVAGEQWFALPESVLATHAQLHVRSLYGHAPTTVVLGEWKVVAQPGTVPAGLELDLAPPERGGHIVWMEPQPVSYDAPDTMLSADPTLTYIDVPDDPALGWVLGFRDGRAARVSRLGWVHAPDSDPDAVITKVAISGSLDSPLGPWEPLGSWSVGPGDDGSVAPFVLDSPTWIRYLRFEATVPSKATASIDLPATLSAIEEPLPEDARSALGEWGATGSDGPYEWAHPPDLAYPVEAVDVSDTPEGAAPLSAGDVVDGRVHRGSDVDWYAITVLEGDNSVTLTLAGTPTVGAAIDVVDADGITVPATFGPGRVPGTIEYRANVPAAGTYRVQVRQPPLSAIVAFDTSISLSSYQPLVTQSIRAYAAGVVPGQEVLNFLPFAQEPLVEDWTDDPWILRSAVDGFLGDVSSSSAETAIIDASRLLSSREGARAILLLTDGETSSPERSTEMWQTLDSVRPSIFAVHIGGNGQPLLSTRLMRDWAGSGSGAYQYARTHADIDEAFDRMSVWLRRSTGYRLSYATSAKVFPDPEPGSLHVVTPPAADGAPTRAPLAPDVAVEVILDTSGSMRDETRGTRRIDAAKAVLTQLVRDGLPPGTPLALRILGSRADPCGTRLAIPLAPLDPDAVTRLVDGIRVDRQADTALGAAIAAVAPDLAASTGTKILLLITDSEEIWPHPDLCGEDPADAIKQLRAAGIDVRVNVVGLAVDSRQAQRQMRRWAELGNGVFFRADDTASLGDAVGQAISAPFVVHDREGNEVASGAVNGDPIELPPGTYEVVVQTEPRLVIEGVVVSSDETAEVTAVQPATEGEEGS
jgi:hypothetical protein